MVARRSGLASAALLTEALGGGPFTVSGPEPVEGPEVAGYSGFADAPNGITFRFRVGPARRSVQVETSLGPGSHPWGEAFLATQLLFRMRRPRLPITIGAATFRLKVRGRSRAFKGCAIGDAIVGEARFDDVNVTVTCAEGLPGDGFALTRLEGAQLTQLLRSERKRWGNYRAGRQAS